MLALPHTLDEVEWFVNPEEDFWTPLVPVLVYEEGWTFVLEEFNNFRMTSSNFWFLVAVEKETKPPISCLFLLLDEASTNGEEPLYTIGYYYTHPEWRGVGVGMPLFKKAMSIVGDSNIAMNSVLHMISGYATNFGFYNLRPYQLYYATINLKDIASPQEITGFVAKNLDEVEWKDVVEYDVSIRTRKREKYLRKLLEPSETVFSKVILNTNGKVVGFGSIRGEVGVSMAVGPLYADNKDIARLIIDSVIPSIHKEKYSYMYAIYPKSNLDAERLLGEISNGKFETTPSTQPLFKKDILPIADMKVFSVTDVAMSFI